MKTFISIAIKSSYVRCLSICFVSILLFTQISNAQITPGSPNNFVTEWNTMNSTTIEIRTRLPHAYNYRLYWVEIGNPSNNNMATMQTPITNPNSYVITGLTPNTNYRVEIAGTFPCLSSIGFNDIAQLKIRKVVQWGSIVWESLNNAFGDAIYLDIAAQDVPNLGGVGVDLSHMFRGCSALVGATANWNWNTSKVTRMEYMFAETDNFNRNIGNWDVSKVTNFQNMFENAKVFNQNIGSWNTSSATNMMAMFRGTLVFNQNISAWNVSNVSFMSRMFFRSASFNQNLGTWLIKNNAQLLEIFRLSVMDCENYSATLTGWSNNPLTGVNVNMSLQQLRLYTISGQTARNYLIQSRNWTINGDNFFDTSPILFSEPSKVCVGSSVQLVHNGQAPGGGQAPFYYWTSSDPSVVTVSGGTMTGVSPGTATITLIINNTPPPNCSWCPPANPSPCSREGSIVVTVHAKPNVNITASKTTICAGETITLTRSGNATTWLWSGGGISGNQTTKNVSPTTNTTYSLKGTNANGCDSTTSITITVNQNPTAVISNSGITNVTCNGEAMGSAKVTVVGGTGTYTYSWNTNPIQTTQTATSLEAGNYTVTVKDANDCQTTANVEITEPTKLVATIDPADVVHVTTCNGEATGSAKVTVVGGTGNYTYSWNSNPVQTTQTATNLSAGNYTVTVKDASNCTATDNITITQPAGCTSCTEPTLTLNAATTCQNEFYSVYATSNGTLASSSGNIVSDSIINIPIGTNAIVTATDGLCSISATAISPATCPDSADCTFPSLTTSNGICDGVGSGTYSVAFVIEPSTAGTASAGTVVGNVVSGIPIGTNVTLTAGTGNCAVSVERQSPINCENLCENGDFIAVVGTTCKNESYDVYFVASANVTIMPSAGTLQGNVITEIPIGTDLTITAILSYCITPQTYIILSPNVAQCDKDFKMPEEMAPLKIPNAFSPNGDGKDDFFVIAGLPENSTLSIYNNWGSLVYRSLNYKNDWNGTCGECIFKGDGLPTSTYYYVLELGEYVQYGRNVYRGFVYLAR